MTELLRLTTLDNLDEQLGGEAREFLLVREEGYADRNYSKQEAERIINKERARKKLIADGWMPLDNVCSIGKYIVQNMTDKQIVLSPEVIAQNDMPQEMQIDIPSTLNYKPTLVGSNSSETLGPRHSNAHPGGLVIE